MADCIIRSLQVSVKGTVHLLEKKNKKQMHPQKKEDAFLDFLHPAEYCNQNLCVTGAMDRLQQTLSLTIMELEELLYGLQVVTI